jgi:hypothetical protein
MQCCVTHHPNVLQIPTTGCIEQHSEHRNSLTLHVKLSLEKITQCPYIIKLWALLPFLAMDTPKNFELTSNKVTHPQIMTMISCSLSSLLHFLLLSFFSKKWFSHLTGI